MENQPLVSIIIPTFNCIDYVIGAIITALNQTYTNIEVIVINDGSTDVTADVLVFFKNKLNYNFHLINQLNKGAGAARNAGIAASKGEYIAFLDADDCIERNYIKYAMEKIIDKKLDAIAGNFFYTDEVMNLLYLNPAHKITPAIFTYLDLIKQPLPMAFSVIKRSFLHSKIHDERLRYAEDFDMWLSVLKKGAKWGYMSTPLAYYMLRQTSTCHTYQKNIAKQLWLIYQKHIDVIGYFLARFYYKRHLVNYRLDMIKKAYKNEQKVKLIKYSFYALKLLCNPIILSYLVIRKIKKVLSTLS